MTARVYVKIYCMDVILPTDLHILQDGYCTTTQINSLNIIIATGKHSHWKTWKVWKWRNYYYGYYYSHVSPLPYLPCHRHLRSISLVRSPASAQLPLRGPTGGGAAGEKNHGVHKGRKCHGNTRKDPLVNIQKAIENGHRNSEFSHQTW